MALKLSNTLLPYDYILDKPSKKLLLIETESDDGGSDLAAIVDSFLTSVVEAYGMVSELTTADKEQVSLRLAAVKEMSVKCIHEMKGGSFNGEKWKSLVRSVMDTLRETVSEARRAQMLRQLQLCENNLDGILKCSFIEIILTEYKRLLLNSSRLLEYVYKYVELGTLKGQQTQNVLLLCASQIQKLFHVLLRALEVSDRTSGHCTEAKDYTVKRMTVCLLKIKHIVEGKIIEQEDDYDDLGGGLFITHMDQALSFLAVFETTPVQSALSDQWRSSVEAVLQHAMLIAQIASEFDFKMIHASGEKILRECENLEMECKSSTSNPSVCKLHAASVSNALEELEQRVCASVLKMYLQVFSAPLAPLQALCDHCQSSPASGEERKTEDLSHTILAFDSHMDRILQVALFAIACSEDQKRVLGIRSCLASLESLETHLVPALCSLYLKQAPSQSMLACLLVEHWSSEVKQLWQLIDGIVDPAALAQVTHNVIWSPTALLKKSIMANKVLDQDSLKKLVKTVVCNAEVLSHQLQVSSEELHFSQYPSVLKALEDLLMAVREGKAVLQRIQGQNATLSIERILKRCELLVSCVGHLQPLLENLDDLEGACVVSGASEPAVPPAATVQPRVGSSPCRTSSAKPQNVKQLISLGLPLDAEIEIDTTDTAVTLDFMQSFMDKSSAQPRFTTSFLYNDKSRVSLQAVGATPRGTPSSHIFSRKPLKLERQILLQQTFSLDVPKLARLSETLRPQSSSNIQPLSTSLKKSHIVEDEIEEENASNDITTPERIRDLMHVQNKIDAVKIFSQCCD